MDKSYKAYSSENEDWSIMQANGRDLMIEIGYALFHVEATVQ